MLIEVIALANLLLVAAAAPALAGLLVVVALDGVRGRPAAPVMRVWLWGLLTPWVALLPEVAAIAALALLQDSARERWLSLGFPALAIGMVEEGSKYWFLRRFALRRGLIRRPYDGVVYAVAIAAAFAAVENLFYSVGFAFT